MDEGREKLAEMSRRTLELAESDASGQVADIWLTQWPELSDKTTAKGGRRPEFWGAVL